MKRAVWPEEPVDDEAVRGWRAVIVKVKKGGSRKKPVEQVKYRLQYSLLCPTLLHPIYSTPPLLDDRQVQRPRLHLQLQ